MPILLSIIIPTFNGEKTIEKTLHNLCSQIIDKNYEQIIEIVITDDASTDKTVQIVEKLITPHSFLCLYENENNLGMDKNFLQSMRNASGKYAWFCGQDDEILPPALDIVVNLLTNNKNVQNMYLDFAQYDEQKKQIVCRSMVDLQLVNPLNEDTIVVGSSSEYFSVISDAPSFLPATIVRLDKQLLDQLKPFMCTHYVQYAYFALGLNLGTTIILRKQLIRGPIPLDGWQKNGNSLYKIAVGKMYCQYLLNTRYNSVFPKYLLNKKKNDFLNNYFKLLLLSFYYGLSEFNQAEKQLRQIFSSGFQRFYMFFLNLFFKIAIDIKQKFVTSR